MNVTTAFTAMVFSEGLTTTVVSFGGAGVTANYHRPRASLLPTCYHLQCFCFVRNAFSHRATWITTFTQNECDVLRNPWKVSVAGMLLAKVSFCLTQWRSR
jgi:hypothetical protein